MSIQPGRGKPVSDETGSEIVVAQQTAGTPEAISAREILSINQNIAWGGGVTFDQLIIRKQDEGFLAIVKGVQRGKPVVAYVGGRHFAETIESVAEWAAKGDLVWKVDIYPSARVRAH